MPKRGRPSGSFNHKPQHMLALRAEGKANAEIAEAMHCSITTVARTIGLQPKEITRARLRKSDSAENATRRKRYEETKEKERARKKRLYLRMKALKAATVKATPIKDILRTSPWGVMLAVLEE